MCCVRATEHIQDGPICTVSSGFACELSRLSQLNHRTLIGQKITAASSDYEWLIAMHRRLRESFTSVGNNHSDWIRLGNDSRTN